MNTLLKQFNPKGNPLPANETEVNNALTALIRERGEKVHGSQSANVGVSLVSFQAGEVTLKRSAGCATCPSGDASSTQTEDTMRAGLKGIWRNLKVQFEAPAPAKAAPIAPASGRGWTPPIFSIGDGKGKK